MAALRLCDSATVAAILNIHLTRLGFTYPYSTIVLAVECNTRYSTARITEHKSRNSVEYNTVP